MANIEQLKAQVSHLGCEKKKIISLEVLILHLQGECHAPTRRADTWQSPRDLE